MKRFSMLTLVVTLTAVISAQGVYATSKKLYKTPPEHVYMKEKQDVSYPQEAFSLSGKIVETMNSGGYTYVCIENDGKKTWAAVPEMKVTVGQEIALQPGHEMTNFSSKTLNRTFDKIVFSSGLATADSTIETKSFHGKAVSKDIVASHGEKIQVEKASGQDAYTVAELYEKTATLDKKTVTIRGKVVKVSSGIMGKNWLHIQDGSGKQDDGSNDLVVTTKDLPAVGEIVTVNGTLYKDKDFGSGYKYDVIIEEASIKK
ncbi:MAG: DNA-binding protein [Candidatus Brocadia sp.]|jgi:hypothetical protein